MVSTLIFLQRNTNERTLLNRMQLIAEDNGAGDLSVIATMLVIDVFNLPLQGIAMV